jgi:hypothetical protein
MSDIKDTYTFVSDNDKNWQCIALNGGKFHGVIYKYGKVEIPEAPSKDYEGDLPFKFHYDIVDPNGLKRESFGDDFFSLIGDILVDIIEEQIEGNNLEYNPDD